MRLSIEERKRAVRGQAAFMLIGAAIFAYFGFATGWAHQWTNTTPSQLLVMVVVLKWTLRGGAIAFGIAALLSFAGATAGLLLYAVAGLATSVLFLVVAGWEWTNPQGYYSGVPAILLVLFAAWNGWGSWSGLQAALALRAGASGGTDGGDER